MDDVLEIREVMVRTGNDRCTLVTDMTITNHCEEAVVDSRAQVSVFSSLSYGRLSVNVVDVDLGDDHGNYSMTMYVADTTDNCILGLDYLKAREAVIDLSQGVLVVNCSIVKGNYKYAEGTSVRTHKVRLVNDCHLFSKFSE